jgi:hypothetical protein
VLLAGVNVLFFLRDRHLSELATVSTINQTPGDRQIERTVLLLFLSLRFIFRSSTCRTIMSTRFETPFICARSAARLHRRSDALASGGL